MILDPKSFIAIEFANGESVYESKLNNYVYSKFGKEKNNYIFLYEDYTFYGLGVIHDNTRKELSQTSNSNNGKIEMEVCDFLNKQSTLISTNEKNRK